MQDVGNISLYFTIVNGIILIIMEVNALVVALNFRTNIQLLCNGFWSALSTACCGQDALLLVVCNMRGVTILAGRIHQLLLLRSQICRFWLALFLCLYDNLFSLYCREFYVFLYVFILNILNR